MPLVKYRLKKFKNRNERLSYYNYITNKLKKYKNGIPVMCLKKKGNEWFIMDNGIPIFKIIYNLGSKKQHSLNAEAKALCYPLTKKNKCDFKKKIQLAVKLLPLTENEYVNAYFNKNIPSKKTLKFHTWKELYILQQCTKLIVSKKAYNLPLMYGYFVCLDVERSDYQNINIRNNYERRSLTNKNVLLLNELSDYDLKMYINEKRFKGKGIIITIIRQVLMGLFNLKNNINCINMDLHLGNILVSITNEDGFYKYIIKNKPYYLGQNNILVKLWDFGLSLLLKEDSNKEIIKRVLNHHKLYFSYLTQKQLKTIEKNLKKEKYKKLLYSIDIWRFFITFSKTLLRNKYIKKDDDIYRSFDSIIIEAEKDITEKLYSKKYKKPSITVEKLIDVFFYEKKPKKIIDTFRFHQ